MAEIIIDDDSEPKENGHKSNTNSTTTFNGCFENVNGVNRGTHSSYNGVINPCKDIHQNSKGIKENDDRDASATAGHKEGGWFRTFRKKWNDKEHRRKVKKTALLSAAAAALGFAVGLRGPAFLDLQIITNTDVTAASFFFTANSVGNLVGSIIFGVLYDKVRMSSLLMFISVAGMGIVTVIVPWCSVYGLMVAIYFVVANFAGGLDTVSHAELFHIWGKEGETAMQFMQFSFAVGGIVSPLVIEPFLAPNPKDPEVDNTNMSSTWSTVDNTNMSSTWSTVDNTNMSSTWSTADNTNMSSMWSTTESNAPNPTITKVFYAYLVSCIFSLLVATIFLVEMIADRRTKGNDDVNSKKVTVTQHLPTSLFLCVTFIVCVFYFIINCIDDTFASLLATFLVKQLLWSKSDSAQISSVFWASFATGRFLSIFTVRWLSSARLILLCGTSLTLSLLGFYLIALYDLPLGVWVCTSLAAMSMGPAFATGFTWMEQELVRVTGRIVSAVMVASSVGNMINPVVTGYLLQQFSPMWFCYVLLGESVLYLLVFLLMLAIARGYVAKHYVIHPELDIEMIVQIPTVAEVTKL